MPDGFNYVDPSQLGLSPQSLDLNRLLGGFFGGPQEEFATSTGRYDPFFADPAVSGMAGGSGLANTASTLLQWIGSMITGAPTAGPFGRHDWMSVQTQQQHLGAINRLVHTSRQADIDRVQQFIYRRMEAAVPAKDMKEDWQRQHYQNEARAMSEAVMWGVHQVPFASDLLVQTGLSDVLFPGGLTGRYYEDIYRATRGVLPRYADAGRPGFLGLGVGQVESLGAAMRSTFYPGGMPAPGITRGFNLNQLGQVTYELGRRGLLPNVEDVPGMAELRGGGGGDFPERVGRRMRNMVELLDAVRSLIRDPDAPVPKLVQVLEEITGGQFGMALDTPAAAGRLRADIMQTHYMAQRAGIPLPQLGRAIQFGVAVAPQYGLGGQFGVQAAMTGALMTRIQTQAVGPGALGNLSQREAVAAATRRAAGAYSSEFMRKVFALHMSDDKGSRYAQLANRFITDPDSLNQTDIRELYRATPANIAETLRPSSARAFLGLYESAGGEAAQFAKEYGLEPHLVRVQRESVRGQLITAFRRTFEDPKLLGRADEIAEFVMRSRTADITNPEGTGLADMMTKRFGVTRARATWALSLAATTFKEQGGLGFIVAQNDLTRVGRAEFAYTSRMADIQELVSSRGIGKLGFAQRMYKIFAEARPDTDAGAMVREALNLRGGVTTEFSDRLSDHLQGWIDAKNVYLETGSDKDREAALQAYKTVVSYIDANPKHATPDLNYKLDTLTKQDATTEELYNAADAVTEQDRQRMFALYGPERTKEFTKLIGSIRGRELETSEEITGAFTAFREKLGEAQPDLIKEQLRDRRLGRKITGAGQTLGQLYDAVRGSKVREVLGFEGVRDPELMRLIGNVRRAGAGDKGGALARLEAEIESRIGQPISRSELNKLAGELRDPERDDTDTKISALGKEMYGQVTQPLMQMFQGFVQTITGGLVTVRIPGPDAS